MRTSVLSYLEDSAVKYADILLLNGLKEKEALFSFIYPKQ